MDIVALLDALLEAGQSEAIQDAVAAAAGDAAEVPLSAIRGLLTGAGVGAAAAVRIKRQLVRVSRNFVFLVTSFAQLSCFWIPPHPPHTRLTDGG
jgi:hypothetical protein